MTISQKQLLWISAGLIIACFVAILIFNLPSISPRLNLASDNSDHIGSAIGGMTAPLIGIFSSLLLYLALSRQTESNFEQRLRNESDIIFLLLNQLDHEIEGFYTSTTKKDSSGEKAETVTGLAGLNVFTSQLRYKYDLAGFPGTFNDFFESGHLLMIVQSFSLIESRIIVSNLNPAVRDLFRLKLDSLYNCKLKHNLINIVSTIDKNPVLEDWITAELRAFVSSHTVMNKKAS